MTDAADPQAVVISSTSEWANFSKPKANAELDVIVDPMIYRTADVFLGGKTGVEKSLPNAGEAWASIQRNIDSLALFFDNLILCKNLPIIDYGITFDKQLGVQKYFIREKCKQKEEVVIAVHVCNEASETARQAALESLKHFESLKHKTPVPESVSAGLAEDMNALEYQWHPDLSQLGEIAPADLPLTRFLYGAALFGGFAQSAGLGHILQPKRSSIYLAASLHADSETAQDDTKLHAKLKKIMDEASGGDSPFAELSGLPPFLPYLLSKDPEDPGALLAEALKLRKTGMVEDYRDLRNNLIRDFRTKGKLEDHYQKQLGGIALKIKKELHGDQESPAEMKVSLTGVEVALKIPLEKIWGWIQGQLPGTRYLKLLTKLTLAQAEYLAIDKHVKTIWQAA
jgi:hypothetical protein